MLLVHLEMKRNYILPQENEALMILALWYLQILVACCKVKIIFNQNRCHEKKNSEQHSNIMYHHYYNNENKGDASS